MPAFDAFSEEQRAEFWACLALRNSKEIGPRRGKALIEYFGSARAAVQTCLRKSSAWTEAGLVPEHVAGLFVRRQWQEKSLEEWRAAKAGNLAVLPYIHPDYPQLLREISDPPLVLYYAGNRALLRGPAIGVVGARSCTKEGAAVCAFLAGGLSRAGVTVVSGMAKGIDRVAHLAGVEGVGGSVGVLGTGIDTVYPSANTDLFRLMREEGLLISEFAPARPAVNGSFPIRNRIISGLSLGVLVVEAAERSGSLITARLAVEQNREVFAVPGHTTAAVSAGCRDLVRRGAKAVFDSEDVLRELAPFLAEHVRTALQQKRRNPAAQARRPEDALHVQMAENAMPILPEGRLPWMMPDAPKAASKRKKNVPAPTVRPKPSEVPAPGLVETQASKSAGTSPSRSAEVPAPKPVGAPASRPEVSRVALSPAENVVLEALGAGAVHLDDLSRRLEQDVAALSGLLTILEVRGLVRRLPGAFYRLPEEEGA